MTVVQSKTAAAAQASEILKAPAVYRSQPVPRVLRGKSAAGPQANVGAPQRHPVTPAAYRPKQTRVAQCSAERSSVPDSSVNAGGIGKTYKNDMLKGGPDTIKTSLEVFWKYWQKNQRDERIHLPAVEEYMELISKGAGIDAPFIDSLDVGVNGADIRTSEGRHRLHAAKKLNKTHIYIIRPADQAMQIAEEVLGIKDELFPG